MGQNNRDKKLRCEQLEPRQMLTTFYVDGPGGDGPGGSDTSGSGLSPSSAFATIQRAADIAGAGDTILIRGGTYREQVNQPRSGAGDLFPITYQAYNGEDVIISGGDLISGWTHDTDDIWKATVTWNANNNRENNTLFVNGDLKFEARQFAEGDPLDIDTWGALQQGSISQGGTTILLDELQGDPASKWVGSKVKFHVADWAFETKTITAFNSASGLATLDSPIDFVSQKQTNGYYLFDTIEALDKPGEWYKDNSNTLYYHAEPGQDPNNLEIEFKSRGYGFDLRERSSIIIDGITFRGVSIYADAGSNNNTYENNVFYGYGKGPSNDFGRFYILGEDTVFRGNKVFLTYGGAFDLEGRRNQVVNNYFHDTGIDGLGGVITSRGSEQLIAYNTVRNFARSFADGYSINSEYAYNLFEDGGNLSWDTGVFDADGTNGDSSFSIFHHNVFRNTSARGIFLAVYGRNNNAVYHHNFIYDFSGVQAPFSAGGINFRQGYHNTIIGTAPATLGVDVDQRVAVQTRYNNSLQISLANVAASGIDTRGNHNYTSSDFFDLNARDLRLAAGSGAIDVGIVLPGINDGYAGDAPDAGALEFGEAMWDVGHNFINKPNPVYNWSLLPGMNLYTNPQFLQGIGDWNTTSGSPNSADRNSWNLKEVSLTGSSRTASVEFKPGDSISRTFTGLKPDTTYTLGAAVRVIEEVVSRGDQFSASTGSVATGIYRGEHYVTGFTAGEWVRFDNIDFGDGYQFDQIEVIHGRNTALNPIEGATIQLRLDSPNGPVISEFSSLIDNHFWYSATDDLPLTTGTHSVYVSVSGPNSQNVAISLIRLLKQNPPERDKLMLNVATPGLPTQIARFGRPRWDLEYETLVFQTGPTATTATVSFTNAGRINSYLDRIYLVEGDTNPTNDLAQLYGEARQSSTASGLDAALAVDGEVNTFSKTQNQANSWWQVGFPEDSLIGEIELVNQSTSSYGDLSNFTVSVWDGDPEAGGVKQWEKAFFANGSVAKGEILRIAGSEVGDDGQTRLASALGSHIRVQLNGLNNNGNGHLALADVNVFLATDAPAIENIARDGTAAESSDFYRTFRLADWALDGNIESFSHTESETGWWQVELSNPTALDQLVVFNTTRFGNFRLSAWATDPRLGGSALWSKDYFVGADEILTVNGSTLSGGNQLDSFSNAKYFRIDRLNSGFLALDEVQIWSNDTLVGGFAPTTVDLNASSYRYDFGTPSSPVESGYQSITPNTFGDISWTTSVQALDRGASANALDRDLVYLTADGSTLRHRIANGIWEVKLRMGDNNVDRDDMTIRAEGELVNDDIDAAAGSFATVGRSGTSDQSFFVTVTDGFLDLEFHDNGGNTDWVVNSLEITAAAGTAESDLSLEIDELTGEAYLANRTSDVISLEGYSIVDPNDGLTIVTWQSLDDSNYDGGAWLEANPTSGTLSELNPLAATSLASGESIFIGTIADPIASPSLRLLYFTEGQEDASPGFVLYKAFTSTPGDFNTDGSVDALDLAQWGIAYATNADADADNDADSDGSDFLAWQRNYSPATTLAAATIENNGSNRLPANAVVAADVTLGLQSISVPAELTDDIAVEVAIDGSPVTLELSRYSLRSDNFRLLVQEADGSLTEIDAGPETTYRGRVAEQPQWFVNAIFIDGQLRASIFDEVSGRLLWTIEPSVGDSNGRYLVEAVVTELFDGSDEALLSHDHNGDGVPDHAPQDHGMSGGGGHGPGCSCPACCDQSTGIEAPVLQATNLEDYVIAASHGNEATDEEGIIAAGQADAMLLNPVSVKQAEIAFDVSYRALRNRYGMPANPTQPQIDAATNAALNQINTFLSGTIEQRLNTIWLRDALVEHRLGTVVFRITPGPYVPVEDAIIAERNDGDDDVPNSPGTNSDMLNAFRNVWNSGVHGNTHDLAHLIIGSGGGGLAWVGSVGNSFRYSQADGGSANAWFGFARHEVGHTWGLSHSHGGVEFFQQGADGGPSGDRYGIMWGPNHGALTPLEQQRVVQEREENNAILDDIGAFTAHNVRPYAALDTFSLVGEGTFMLDVLDNDFDANNDGLFISGVGDRFSSTFTYASGSVVSIGHGLGDRGQDVMLYSPAPGLTSETLFYRANDGTLDNFGQVNISLDSPLENLGAYQFDFGPNTAGTYADTDTPRFVGDTYTTWNSVTRNDTDVTSVLDAEGNASGVTLKVRETNDGGTFNFAAAGGGLEDRTATNYTGLYGTQLMTDLMFTRNGDDLGIQINGLPAGEYAVFAMLREPDASTRTYSVDIGVGTSDTVRHGDFGLGNATALPADDPLFWVDNQNFYTETVSVGSSDSVFVLIDSTDSDFVSLQGLQIVRLTSPLNFEVDTTTGRAALHNVSDEAVVIDGYGITSLTNSLRPNAWQSLDDQAHDGGAWIEFLATDSALVEVNPTGTTTIAPGQRLVLGSLFDINDSQSIDFSFTSPALTGEIFIPVVFDTFANPADFDLDQDVDNVDLAIWQIAYGQNDTADTNADRDSDGSDFLFWQRSLGADLGGAPSIAASFASDQTINVAHSQRLPIRSVEEIADANYDGHSKSLGILPLQLDSMATADSLASITALKFAEAADVAIEQLWSDTSSTEQLVHPSPSEQKNCSQATAKQLQAFQVSSDRERRVATKLTLDDAFDEFKFAFA